jgi:hypothetical protein
MLFDDIVNNSFLQDQMDELNIQKVAELEKKQEQVPARKSNRQSNRMSTRFTPGKKLADDPDMLFNDLLENPILQD